MEEKKFSVKELVSAFDKMSPDHLALCTVLLLFPRYENGDPQKIISTITQNKETKDKNGSLFKALSNWNWDSHPPHTDDAILVLVEELLEEYKCTKE